MILLLLLNLKLYESLIFEYEFEHPGKSNVIVSTVITVVVVTSFKVLLTFCAVDL